MDLNSGFWQVEVHQSDREKTAFSTHQGLYQFGVCTYAFFGYNMTQKLHSLLEKYTFGRLKFQICIYQTFKHICQSLYTLIKTTTWYYNGQMQSGTILWILILVFGK
jgi:hypothetical protein